MKFLVPSLKHFLHTIVMISWIIIGISITLNHRGEENPFTNYGIILGLILILIRLVSLLAFPQTFLNFISLLIHVHGHYGGLSAAIETSSDRPSF